MDTIKYITEKYGMPTKKIKGVIRNDLYNDFRELGFTEGAEIGVFRGVNARIIFDAIPNLKLHVIDSWLPVGKRTVETQKKDYERMKRILRSEIKNGQVHIIKKWSLDAVRDFKKESLDFVYIDANHAFDFVIQDIIQWASKVKEGGIISGHDYHYKRPNCGVIAAVNIYTSFHNLNWYLLDNEKDRKTQTNNSWFFIKGWRKS